jgi:tRNA nucleotidyltransferase (CCA-adding enzyme)
MLEELEKVPGGPQLLAVAGADVYLVGGAVRDLLRGERPRELDVVVEGDPRALVQALGSATVYDRFGTATVHPDGGRIDIAGTRRERYPAPGALPEVERATLEEDLLRRDFTVNAIAMSLRTGELHAAPHALEDLDARQLRVLHDESFIDDPTRLLRLARYAVRLGFDVEPHTQRLADAATFATLSGARIGAELRLVLDEPDPLAVLRRIHGLPLAVDDELICAALALTPADASRGLLILAAVTRGRANAAWLEALELTARERDVITAAWNAEDIALSMADANRPSQLHAVLHAQPPEAVALAGALGPLEVARLWLEELRRVRLEISGDDLLAAGIPQGPEVGERLARTLARKLDGELTGGREQELAAAIASRG